MSSTIKKTLKIIALVIVIIIAAKWLWLNRTPTGPILFVSSTCPHCKNVEDFIAKNKVLEKFTFEQKQIDTSMDDSLLFQKVGKQCGIAQTQLGVPLFFIDGRCILGDTSIIDFLQEKIK